MCLGIALGILLALWGFHSEISPQYLVKVSIFLTVLAVISRVTFFAILKRKHVIDNKICKKGV